MNTLLFALWFFGPAGLANAAPVLAAKLPILKNWKTPLDFGVEFRGKQLFGKNKTWRGLLAGILIAIFVVWIQSILYQHSGFIQDISQSVDYQTISVPLLGLLLGAGALLGDAIESFVKRQINVPPGESWFPFDQLDYIIGGLLASSLIVVLSAQQYMAIIAVWFGLHLISVYFGYLVGIRDKAI